MLRRDAVAAASGVAFKCEERTFFWKGLHLHYGSQLQCQKKYLSSGASTARMSVCTMIFMIVMFVRD